MRQMRPSLMGACSLGSLERRPPREKNSKSGLSEQLMSFHTALMSWAWFTWRYRRLPIYPPSTTVCTICLVNGKDY